MVKSITINKGEIVNINELSDVVKSLGAAEDAQVCSDVTLEVSVDASNKNLIMIRDVDDPCYKCPGAQCVDDDEDDEPEEGLELSDAEEAGLVDFMKDGVILEVSGADDPKSYRYLARIESMLTSDYHMEFLHKDAVGEGPFIVKVEPSDPTDGFKYTQLCNALDETLEDVETSSAIELIVFNGAGKAVAMVYDKEFIPIEDMRLLSKVDDFFNCSLGVYRNDSFERALLFAYVSQLFPYVDDDLLWINPSLDINAKGTYMCFRCVVGEESTVVYAAVEMNSRTVQMMYSEMFLSRSEHPFESEEDIMNAAQKLFEDVSDLIENSEEVTEMVQNPSNYASTANMTFPVAAIVLGNVYDTAEDDDDDSDDDDEDKCDGCTSCQGCCGQEDSNRQPLGPDEADEAANEEGESDEA